MLPLSTYTSMDAKLKRIFDEISYRTINGRIQPLVVDEQHRKVGINTDNPTKELDVNGEIKAKGAFYDYLSVLGSLSAAGIDVKSLLTTARLGVTDSAFINNATLFGTTNASNLNALTTTLKDTTITGDLTVSGEVESKKIFTDEANIGNLKAKSLGVAQHLIAGTGSIGRLITNQIDGIKWLPWTPVFTNLTVGNGTLVARYLPIGSLVNVRINLIWGSTTSISGSPSVTLPVQPAGSTAWLNGLNNYLDSGTENYFGLPEMSGNSLLLRYCISSTSSLTQGALANNAPFTWTTNDVIRINFSYESI